MVVIGFDGAGGLAIFKAGDCVENPVTGQRLLISKTELDTQGAYVEVEYVLKPFSGKSFSPRHFHPIWTERFEILSGFARYGLGYVEHAAERGDVLAFPAGVPHVHPWNAGPEELHVRQATIASPSDPEGLRAALTAIETLFQLAQVGRVNHNGLPNLLQLAVVVRTMMPNTYLGDIPVPVQRPLFGVLAAAGRLAGFKASYPTRPDA